MGSEIAGGRGDRGIDAGRRYDCLECLPASPGHNTAITKYPAWTAGDCAPGNEAFTGRDDQVAATRDGTNLFH